MPALPPAPGTTRAVLNATAQGIPVANVLHFQAPPGPDAPDPTLLADRLADWWVSSIRPLVSGTVTLVNVTCTDLSAGGPPAVVGTTGLPSSGTSAAQPLSNNCALVMSLVTGLRGRSFRGRIYAYGMGEDQANGNQISSTYRDSLVAAYSQLIIFTAVGEPDYQLGVLSYQTGGVFRSEGLFTPVTTIRADTVMDTQRRRMR